ncbi:hypothetical protein FEP80_03904 [Burkholderia multivorans]|nr:hypothetical protein [Burkholderia multivorans]
MKLRRDRVHSDVAQQDHITSHFGTSWSVPPGHKASPFYHWLVGHKASPFYPRTPGPQNITLLPVDSRATKRHLSACGAWTTKCHLSFRAHHLDTGHFMSLFDEDCAGHNTSHMPEASLSLYCPDSARRPRNVTFQGGNFKLGHEKSPFAQISPMSGPGTALWLTELPTQACFTTGHQSSPLLRAAPHFNRAQPTLGPRNVTFGAQLGPRRVTL